MNNNMKCPFCQQELKYDAWNEVYMCRNPNCKHLLGFGTKELWQELDRWKQSAEDHQNWLRLAEKRLKIAVDALNKIDKQLMTGIEMTSQARNALEQITAEQKE